MEEQIKYWNELLIAQLAVQRAALLTSSVFSSINVNSLSKDDKSPVTIGDFGAQALIIAALKYNFPDDEIVAEEEASTLQSNDDIREQVWKLVRSTKLDDETSEALLGGAVRSEDDMLKLIDMGGSKGGNKGRIWTIDPIDGTKGFLRKGQYAVCLALMVDGDVKVGVLGCPNLDPSSDAKFSAEVSSTQGTLFSAVKGGGATSFAMSSYGISLDQTPIEMRRLTDMTEALFCESVESGHSAHSEQAEISRRLGIKKASVRMDSQAKYASIARGAGDIYLRLPVSATYQEKIWDHAGGYIIVKEAGGEVTDLHGKALDFGLGRTLAANRGIVGAPKGLHAEVLRVVQEVWEEGRVEREQKWAEKEATKRK